MKKFQFLGIIFLFMISANLSKAADMCSAPVKTGEGAVRGMSERVDDGEVCAWKGIPYAAPPVGDLRWRPPAPAPMRDKVLDAVEFGPECSQIEMAPSYLMIGKKPNRHEDCLYLNIWRPAKEGTFPVMVWIHGGGLTSGTGSDPMYWGDRISKRKDIVLVSINYRLGVLGFLAHSGLSAEDEHKSSGNYGLLDQVAALKWVKNNIAGFGGDPNNVTIFGESAGGWSVCMHLASPLSAGLFEKAILQSGGCDTTRTMEQGFKNGDIIASRLGCSGDDVISCMRSKPVDEVVAAMNQRRMATGDFMTLKFWDHVWAPHEDGWFLLETPIKSLREGNYNRVPFMVGSTRDEARLFAAEYKIGYRRIKKSKVEAAIRKSLGDEFWEAFAKLYPFKMYKRPMEAFVDAKGDISLGCKCFEAAEASSKYEPTYYYRFDYADHMAPDIISAGHAMEIPFIFDSLDRSFFKLLYIGSKDKRARPLVDPVMSYWTNFAKYGDPNGQGLVIWPKYDTAGRNRMFLNYPPFVAPTDNVEKCEFWRERTPHLK